MPEEIQQLQNRVKLLENLLYALVKSDKYYFGKHIVLADGLNIFISTGTGTRIGTAAGQKMAFYNSTPIVQPTAVTSAASQGGSYVQADVQTIATAVNDLLTRLRNLGLIAT